MMATLAINGLNDVMNVLNDLIKNMIIALIILYTKLIHTENVISAVLSKHLHAHETSGFNLT